MNLIYLFMEYICGYQVDLLILQPIIFQMKGLLYDRYIDVCINLKRIT